MHFNLGSRSRAVAPIVSAQPTNRVAAPLIHTYQNPQIFSSRFLGSPHLRSFVLFYLITVGFFALTGFRFTRDVATFLGGPFALGLVLVYLSYRYQQSHGCREIRLSDDGTCELNTPRRSIRMHVSEIRSVRYSPAGDDSSESYTIHYRDGSLDIDKEMTGFADFLTRLKALNPALDLSSFPSGWPTSGERTPQKLGPVNRLFSGALFPLIVVILLVYLASQTLLGK